MSWFPRTRRIAWRGSWGPRSKRSSTTWNVFSTGSLLRIWWTSMPATDTHPLETIAFEDIREASYRIRPIAKRTPVMTSRGFNAAAGLEAFFKCENLQTGGAFKIRGAANFVSQLSSDQLARGVVAY